MKAEKALIPITDHLVPFVRFPFDLPLYWDSIAPHMTSSTIIPRLHKAARPSKYSSTPTKEFRFVGASLSVARCESARCRPASTFNEPADLGAGFGLSDWTGDGRGG